MSIFNAKGYSSHVDKKSFMSKPVYHGRDEYFVLDKMIKKQFTPFFVTTDIFKLITNNQIVLFKPQFKLPYSFQGFTLPDMCQQMWYRSKIDTVSIATGFNP